MITHIVFILDRSGSMAGKENDVVGAFNAFLEDQKKLEDEARLTTVLFDDQYEILHDGINIQTVEPITREDYFVRGATALLDAVGRTIDNVDSYVSEDDNVLFFINTDGYENDSKKYNNEQIREMVTHLQDEHGWKFVFLGANVDSFAIGGNMGIRDSFDFVPTSAGINYLYAAMSDTTSTYRSSSGKTFNTRGFTTLTTQDSDSNPEEDTNE